MASEPFEVTDDNGITVTGTVDVYRHPKGPYFDAKSKYYKQPRYADAHFDYFNTREACTIDRNALSKAVEEAFAKALTRFGIEKPDRGKIAEDVNASINATRQQCILNADKYVSNETFSSTNWETGKAVGDLTAKAYAAVPAPGGGVQTVVARENSWPADDVSALRNDASTNACILSRRVVVDDSGNSVENWGSSRADIGPQNPTQPVLPPHVSGATGISSAKPMRYLGRRDGDNPPASVFDAGAPAARFVLPDQLNSSGGPTDWAAASASIGPLNPMQAAPSPQAGETPAISSSKPVRILSRRITDKPPPTAFPNAPAALDRQDSFGDHFGNWTSAPEGIAPHNPNLAAPPPQLGRPLGIFSGKPMPDYPLPPSIWGLRNTSAAAGNGAGNWFTAPAAVDPQSPDQPAPQLGGLLGLLLEHLRNN